MFIDREDATEISSTGMHYDCQHNFYCATDLSSMNHWLSKDVEAQRRITSGGRRGCY